VTEPFDERSSALRAIDATCQHCGAERAPDQAFCVECGRPLPRVRGRVPGLRRRWVRRLGWYPGDAVWASLAALLVAAAGAVAAVAVAQHRHPGGEHVVTALGNVPVGEPSAVVATTAPSTLPAPPEPATQGGRQAWPAGQTGWTIVLVSYPKTTGQTAAAETAARAAKAGLPQVGVLDSSGYPSLQPGYFVVFSGIYDTQSQANGAVASAHQAGFGAAYSRQIAG
jgi:hypothetical protein